MDPRIRTILATLALAVFGAPAQASAAPSWAQVFAAPTICFADPGPFALIATDDTVVSSAWQIGAPAGTVDIPLAGTGVDQFEWMIDCATPAQSAASGVATITGNGTFNFTHRARETGTGDWTAWIDSTVRIDATIPDNTTSPPTSWRRGPVVVNLSGSDSVSPVTYEWRDGISDPWTPGAVATIAGTGVHTLQTAVVDSAGNRNERSDTVMVDDAVPVDDTVTASGWQPAAADVTITGSDVDSGVARVDWELDGASGTGPSGSVVHIGTQGSHTLRTRIVDNVDNDSGWTTRTVRIDISAPLDTTLVAAGWVTTPTVNVSVSGTDGGGSGVVRVEWELDDLTNGDVASAGPVAVLVAGDGAHKLETRVTDAVGNTSGWRTQFVRIDTVTPTDTTITSAGWESAISRNVTVHGTDAHSGVDHLQFRLDGVFGTAAGDTRIVAVSGNGEHTLETRVVDVAGNVSAWIAHAIRLDSTAPTNTTPAADTGWRTTSYSVELNGDDSGSSVDSVRWRVNGGAEMVGTLGVETALVTGTGVHTLETRIRDVAGNFSSWRSETIRIDAVKPADTTVYPAAAVPNGRKVPITATDAHSGPSGSVEWQLDAGAIKTSTSALIIGAGSHTLRTRVQDNAGNWSDWRSGTVTVDGSLPFEDADAPTDTTTIPATWRTGPTTVTVTADDNGGSGVANVQWRYDGNAIESGPSGSSFTVSADGRHEIETRATDATGNISAWRSQNLNIDSTLPQDTSALPTGWTNTRSFTLSATDATSGIARIHHSINGGTVQYGAAVTVPGDGTFTIGHRVEDVAGQLTGWKYDVVKADTALPVNTTAAAPSGWQTVFSLALSGTDALSGVDHAEWRVDLGAVQAGSPAAVTSEGTQTLDTRIVDIAGNASAWRSETIEVDHTMPVNTTPVPAGPWRNSDYSTTVTATDAAPGSGLLGVEYRLDDGAIVPAASVTIAAEGTHKLESRALDIAGNVSDWRVDTVGIDKTVPTLTADCGSAAWRNTPPVCSVTADGGLSGLPTLTAARGGSAAEPVVDGHVTVSAEGASTLTFRAVDGAGNEATTAAGVNVDLTAPAAAVDCTPDAGTGWICTGSGADELTGLTGLTWSLDGGVAVAVGADGTFTAGHGSVVVTATDGAGNTGSSAALALADRTPPPPPPPLPPVAVAPPVKEHPTPRVSSAAVRLRGPGSASGRLLGQLSLSATPTRTTVDLRPLALGKGRFRFVFKVTIGKKTKTVTKTQTATKAGYSTRIRIALPPAAHSAVALTVSRRSGGRWVSHATSRAELE